MLEPKPNAFVSRWFDWYCGRALRKFFHRVHVYGASHTVPFDPNRSTVYVGNHSCFWDALVVNHWIKSTRRQPTYCMVDADQVREHPFFRKIGGIAVERGKPRDAIRALDYAADRLRNAPCAVVIFPQGKIEPARQRPLGFERGVGRLLSKAPHCQVVLVALHYEFWLEQRPELLMDVSTTTERDAGAIEALLTARVDVLRERSDARVVGDQILVQGRASISQWKRRPAKEPRAK